MKNYFENLCVKAITGNIDANEKTEIDNWLKEDKKNEAYFESLKNTWKVSGNIYVDTNADITEAWNSLSEKLNHEQVEMKTQKPNIIKQIFKPKVGYALAFASVIIIAIISYVALGTNPILKSASTKYGETRDLILSDGSMVKLNSESTLKFYSEFKDIRKVFLEGEAFFEIKKDGRPFLIETQNAITKVLGTKFNVWSRKNETRVVVKEGKVSLANNYNQGAEVILTKNKTSKIVGEERPLNAFDVNVDKKLGWLKGLLVFEKTNLSEVSEELQRYYGIPIKLNLSSNKNLTLTGTFKKEELDTVLAKVCLAFNLKYKQSSDGITITD